MQQNFKTKILPIVAVLYSFQYPSAFSQAPDWAWSKSAGGSGGEYSTGIATDATGNIYLSGHFSGASITFGTTVLTNVGNSNMFLAKYSPAGNVIWAKSAGGTVGDGANAIATDNVGNIFISGSFSSSTIAFGSTVLTNTGDPDFFLAKYDPDGNVLWAKSGVGSGMDVGIRIATDPNGNVFASGQFLSSTLSFGSVSLTNAGGSDFFVVKYDSNGNALWARSGDGNDTDISFSIATDNDGNVIVGGMFASYPFTIGTTIINNPGDYSMFIAKYDPAGTLLWAKAEGGSGGNEGASSIVADQSGNIYVGGGFETDNVTIGTTLLNHFGQADNFLIKYSPAGNVVWAKSFGGIMDEGGVAITYDGNGNLYTQIAYKSPSVTLGGTTLNNAGGDDFYVAKYNLDGEVQWAKTIGGSGNEAIAGISTDHFGNVCITGSFVSPSVTFGTSTFTNAGLNDLFVVKLGNLTDISETVANTDGLIVSPNPNTGNFYLETLLTKGGNYWLEIKDLMGRTLYQQSKIAGAGLFVLPLQLSEKGIYFVSLRNSEGAIMKKVVVE